jgi:hypothetical protein
MIDTSGIYDNSFLNFLHMMLNYTAVCYRLIIYKL